MPIKRRGGSGGTTLSENIVAALEGAASPAAVNPFATLEDIPEDLSADIEAALTSASSPSAENPFATVGDLEESGADDKTVKASSTDATPGYLDAKVDDVTLEVSGDKLAVKSTFLATTSAAGLMSAEDKKKLNSSLALMIALS